MATVCTNKELAKALHKLAIPETGDASTIVGAKISQRQQVVSATLDKLRNYKIAEKNIMYR